MGVKKRGTRSRSVPRRMKGAERRKWHLQEKPGKRSNCTLVQKDYP